MHLSLSLLSLVPAAFVFPAISALSLPPTQKRKSASSRRDFCQSFAVAALATFPLSQLFPEVASAAPQPNGIKLSETPSGLKWAEVKTGSGQPLSKGTIASIDYSMASTAGRFPQIYSTKDSGSPYRWVLGDGSTIPGIEMAVLGDSSQGIPPMAPGSIRRVIVPQNLGYDKLMKSGSNSVCVAGGPGSINPIPPKENIVGTGAYQRWYQFYCNPRIPYQPDLVLDIKLYGKR